MVFDNAMVLVFMVYLWLIILVSLVSVRLELQNKVLGDRLCQQIADDKLSASVLKPVILSPNCKALVLL